MHNPNVCFYFQVHQPYRLKDLRVTELHDPGLNYFDDKTNREIFRKVAEKCYLPTNALLLKKIKEHPEFKISFSLSGVFIDQCLEYGPDVLASFKALADTGNVEFLAETYYHSLSFFGSLEEFCQQVQKHSAAIKKYFNQTPKVFRNTELIYNNELGNIIKSLGFSGIVTEGTDRHLAGRNPNNLFKPYDFELSQEAQATIKKYRVHKKAPEDFYILLKNYQLSDDIAFRFSNQAWPQYPLTANKFTDWLHQNSGHTINLFMDYETFGEHQWEESGIFEFLNILPDHWENHYVNTSLPSEVVNQWHKDWHAEVYDVHEPISWADSERDLSAWRGNHIQEAAFAGLYELDAAVQNTKDPAILETWRKLQTSDHLYYMCTKFWADGDVHKYFSPYDSPYEAYRRFSHALEHLRTHLPAIS